MTHNICKEFCLLIITMDHKLIGRCSINFIFSSQWRTYNALPARRSCQYPAKCWGHRDAYCQTLQSSHSVPTKIRFVCLLYAMIRHSFYSCCRNWKDVIKCGQLRPFNLQKQSKFLKNQQSEKDFFKGESLKRIVNTTFTVALNNIIKMIKKTQQPTGISPHNSCYPHTLHKMSKCY